MSFQNVYYYWQCEISPFSPAFGECLRGILMSVAVVAGCLVSVGGLGVTFERGKGNGSK